MDVCTDRFVVGVFGGGSILYGESLDTEPPAIEAGACSLELIVFQLLGRRKVFWCCFD